MKKVAIFDMDGTLLDSIPDIMASFNKMLAQFGYPAVNREQVIEAVGHGGETFVRTLLPEGHKHEIPVCRPVYNEIYRTCGSPLTVAFPGVEEALTKLKNAGVKLAILSNKPHTNTVTIYELKLGQFHFDVVFGNRDGVAPKPDPAAICEMLSLLNLSPEDAVMIGDGEADMQVAKNAGVESIAVGWGYRPLSVLKEHGAVHTVTTVEEMTDLILSL
jgi:phosphoglycolate phosphatase